MQGRERRREQSAPQEHTWARAPPGCFPPTFLRAPQACSRGRARRRTLVHHPTTHGPPPAIALGVKPRPSPTVGQTLMAEGLGTTCTAMAVMLHPGPAALPPRSLPPPGCCRRLPSWNLFWGAGRSGAAAGRAEGGEGGSVQSGAINPRAGSAGPAALRGSVFAESAGRLGGAPGPRKGGRADTAGSTRLAGVGFPESEGEGWGTRGGAAPADVRLGLTPLFPNLGDYLAWGADSSRAGRRRRKGPRIRFQPKLAKSSVRRVVKEEVHTRALLLSSPALCDPGLLG